jgi:pimeloyl-ACP methyl ester carboxylesterase
VASESIFISYHRADVEVARRVREQLLARGATTWMDQFDIPPGAYWPDEIDKGLEVCETVVGLLSPDAIASRNVKNEWDWALQNDRRLLLLLVRPCVIPHRYVSINWIDVTGGDLEATVEALCDAAGVGTASVRDTSTEVIPQTHYARSGDGSIAYQVFGEGPVDLVLVPGFISHVEHDWNSPGWAGLLRRLGTLARVIRFDKRGTGLSDRVGRVLTMEERMDDIRAVMDAAASQRAVIFGLSEGGSLAALFAATHPDRTVALMIYGGLASYVSRPDYPWPPTYEEYRQRTEEMAQWLHERWGSEAFAAEIIEAMAPSAAEDPQLIAWMAERLRLGGSPGAEIARRKMNIELDTRDVLPTIGVPAMVLHRTGDRDVHVEEGRYIAGRIPGARFVELAGDDHLPGLGDQGALFDAIETFMKDMAGSAHAEPSSAQKLATVMCLLLPLGGQALGGDMARTVDATIEQFGGQTVDDGPRRMIATFDGSIRAMRAVMALSAAMRAGGYEARFGLHTGEVEVGDASRSGGTIAIAGQLASMAGAGSILVSGNVKDISPGSGVEFVDLGEQAMEGLDGPLRVFLIKDGN